MAVGQLIIRVFRVFRCENNERSEAKICVIREICVTYK
jgi:hypothetical protein